MAQEEQKKESVSKKRNVSKENKDPSKPKEKPPSKVIDLAYYINLPTIF